MIYTKPSLNIVGTVADVILGAEAEGFDLDGTLLPDGMEFEADPQIDVSRCTDR